MFQHRSRCEFESVILIKASHTRTSPGIILSSNMCLKLRLCITELLLYNFEVSKHSYQLLPSCNCET